MIDDDELDRSFLRFQFQPELFLYSSEDRGEAIGIRRRFASNSACAMSARSVA